MVEVKENLSSQDVADFNEYLRLIHAEDNPDGGEVSEIRQNVVVDVEKALQGDTARGFDRAVKTYMEVVRAKIEQFKGNTDFYEHQAATVKTFQRSPRTRLKMAQEILVAPSELQVVGREDLAEFGLEKLMQNIVMDPRKITDTMLRNFGLDEYVPTGRGLSAPERIRERARAIPVIKEFLAKGIEPMNYVHEGSEDRSSFFRLFRVKNGKNVGRVLGVQDNVGKRPFLTDLHSAYRRVDEIEESYKKELEKLNGIRKILGEIRRKILNGGWVEVKSGPELARMMKSLDGIVESLEFVRNEHKEKIKEAVAGCVTFKDGKGRFNPGSKLAIFTKVPPFIDQRIQQTADIMGHLAQDRIRVQNIISEQANVLAGFNSDVEKHNQKLILLDPKKPISPVQKDRIVTNLKIIKAQCAGFNFEPYMGLAKYVVAEVDRIVQVLESPEVNDREERLKAEKSFVKIYVISKVLKLEADLIALRERFFAPGQRLEDVYVKSLIGELEVMHGDFAARKVAPKMRMNEFGRLFGEIYKLLNELKSTARQSLRNGAPSQQRVEALKEIEKKIKEFDPYKTLQGVLEPQDEKQKEFSGPGF